MTLSPSAVGCPFLRGYAFLCENLVAQRDAFVTDVNIVWTRDQAGDFQVAAATE